MNNYTARRARPQVLKLLNKVNATPPGFSPRLHLKPMLCYKYRILQDGGINMELSIEEQTLVATFRNLDEGGQKELLRQASLHKKVEAAASATGPILPLGQCGLDKMEARPEIAAEPIFTE
jgi:hypothetical protein